MSRVSQLATLGLVATLAGAAVVAAQATGVAAVGSALAGAAGTSLVVIVIIEFGPRLVRRWPGRRARVYVSYSKGYESLAKDVAEQLRSLHAVVAADLLAIPTATRAQERRTSGGPASNHFISKRRNAVVKAYERLINIFPGSSPGIRTFIRCGLDPAELEASDAWVLVVDHLDKLVARRDRDNAFGDLRSKGTLVVWARPGFRGEQRSNRYNVDFVIGVEPHKPESIARASSLVLGYVPSPRGA
jgi:hypothetical protein